MPSLKLSNPFRRGVDRPSLKERAAGLKATAARVIRRRSKGVLPEPNSVEARAIRPDPTDLATACVDQIDRLELWDENPGIVSEEQANAEMDRWGAVFRRAISEPSAGPRDLAGKAYLMLADLDRFRPEEDYDTDDYRLTRVIMREVVAMGGLVYAPTPTGQAKARTVAVAGDASGVPTAEDTARPDPVAALIGRHREAYAEWLPHLNMIGPLPLDSPEYAYAQAAGEPARAREEEAYRAVLTARPTTLSGFVTWAAYLSSPTMAASIDGVDDDASTALEAVLAAALSLVPLSPRALPETEA